MSELLSRPFMARESDKYRHRAPEDRGILHAGYICASRGKLSQLLQQWMLVGGFIWKIISTDLSEKKKLPSKLQTYDQQI